MNSSFVRRCLGGVVVWLATSMPVAAATVSIAWDSNPEPDVTGYDVCVRLPNGFCGNGVSIGNRTTWTFTGLADNVQYYLAVRARNSSSTSPWAEIGYRTPPALPPGSEPTRSDFNGDGWFDVLWQNRANGGLVSWHLNSTQVVWARWLSPSAVAPGWKLSGSGDFNRDGKPDLVWHNMDTGQVVYWLMDGVYAYTTGFFPGPVNSDWRIASVRDLNGDGSPDLWWHNQVTGQMVVWYLNGTTLVQAVTPAPAQISDVNWKLRGTADFSGDGLPDALWHNEATGELRVWTLSGINVASATNLNPAHVAPNWRIEAVGDANLDSRPDIVWRNIASGELVLWRMSGTNLLGGEYLSPPTADLNWEIMAPR